MKRIGELLLEVAEAALALARDSLERAADRMGVSVGEFPDSTIEAEPDTVEELLNGMRAADADAGAGPADASDAPASGEAGEAADASPEVAAEEEDTTLVATDDAPPAGVSQLLGDAGISPIYLSPRPLHPRAIEGAEVRATVPVPLRTWQRLDALLRMGTVERVRLNREGLLS